MELTTLRQFIAIARAGHVTRAAHTLGVTQPTLSASLKRLEEELGATLFHRTAKGVELTDAGEAFLQHAEAAVAQADAAQSAVREIVGLNTGRIRIGGGATAVGFLLPHVIRAFRAAHPNVQLYVKETGSRDVARAVRSAELDLGLVTLPLHPQDEQDLIVVARRVDELRLAVPTNHPLASRKGFRWRDIEHEPIIAFEAGSTIRRLIDESAAAHSITLSVAMELRAIDMIVRMVQAGVGLAFVSSVALESAGARPKKIASLTCRDAKLSRTIALVRRADFTPSPASAEFEQLLVEFLRTGLKKS